MKPLTRKQLFCWLIFYALSLAAILAAVVVYAVLVVAMKAVTREDMQLVPKGEKIANLLHMK